ncbi:MAG: SGNH/GDSL hydrolase family protein [Actinomycetales bacterium]
MADRIGDARRAAALVGLAGGGLGALAAAGYGVLYAEMTVARRIIGQPFGDQAPSADGWFVPPGAVHPDDLRQEAGAIRLVILGDSGAAGLGCEYAHQTPGSLLAERLAEASGRAVQLRTLAVVGAETSELAEQVDRLEDEPVHRAIGASVCVIVVGGNDVTAQVRASTAATQLGAVVTRLIEQDLRVVVGTCPDLGTIKPVPQPLRALARGMSRQLAAAQTVAAVHAGACTVSLGDLLGPAFDAEPETLFSRDRFHPSPAGYRRLVEAMAPSVLAAAGHPTDQQDSAPDPVGELTLAEAADDAAAHAGTRIDAQPRLRWPKRRREGGTMTWQTQLVRSTNPDNGSAR